MKIAKTGDGDENAMNFKKNDAYAKKSVQEEEEEANRRQKGKKLKTEPTRMEVTSIKNS